MKVVLYVVMTVSVADVMAAWTVAPVGAGGGGGRAVFLFRNFSGLSWRVTRRG
jgi:hypothetical protein